MDKLLLNRCRSWMLRAENLATVRECRKLVQREFGETLHINDENLLPRICELAACSQNRDLRRLALPIERLLKYGRIGREFTDMNLAHIPYPAGIR